MYYNEYNDTESVLTPFAYKTFFSEDYEGIVDMKKNFDDKLLEPEFLNAKYPVILIKGSFGIGYGKYTGIYPMNLKEIFKLTIELIKNPDKKEVYALPDFPTPCLIVNTDFKEICKTGEGNFRIRGIIVEDGDDLIIKSIPYQTRVEAIKDALIKLAKNKVIPLKDIVDETEPVFCKTFNGKIAKQDISLRLIFKKGYSKAAVLKTIYRSTAMEQSFAVKMDAVNDYESIHYNLKSLIMAWIDFRRDMVNRLLLREYKTAYKEYHLNMPIINIISEENSDKKLAKLMRSCKNKKEQLQKLVEEYSKYDLTDLQAEVIANWSYSDYSQESLENFKNKFLKLEKELKKLEKQLDNESLIDQIIINDLEEGIERFGRDRISKLVTVDDDYVESKEYTVIVTDKGYIKKIPLDADIDQYNTYVPNDRINQIMKINNVDKMMIFTSNGMCYNLAVNDIDETPANGIGFELSDQIKNLKDSDTHIVSVIKMPTEKRSDEYLLFVTKNGLVKKSVVGNYISSQAGNGLIAMNLKKDKEDSKDELVDVLNLGIRDKDLMLYSSNGRGLRFNSKEIPATLRMSSGVIGMRLANSTVTGMSILKSSKQQLIVITNKGNGKRYLLKDFVKSERGKEGNNLIKLSDNESVVNVLTKNIDDSITLVTRNKIKGILVEDIKEKTLISKGDKIGYSEINFIK